jgi:proteasome beta subunit
VTAKGEAERPGLPAAFRAVGGSSFADLVAQVMPHALPAAHLVAGDTAHQIPHGTTVVALTCKGGIVMAGDRRATMGNVISQRDIEKVFPADDHCCIGIAGTAGIAVELVRLFQVELEHYEKIEGTELSLDGKANRLSALLRANLGMALQGLAVLPMLAGYDLGAQRGRIFGYDVTGGRSEESAFHCIGSGALFARGALKKLYLPDLEPQQAAALAVEALYDAADDDSATGGPDITRGIYPSVAVVDRDGYRRMPDAQVSQLAAAMVARRAGRPDGPLAEMA